ncbi:MAG: hypothetical protein JSS36_10950 [Proteobacteria bacterium]|nr:hypothetical protein [Pseudomonadota bacterium]
MIARGQPDPHRALPRPSAMLALWLALFALVTRYAVLGDVAYFNDESFYLLAGQKLHHGLLPYVGVWDRKGPGLFLTYYLLTFFGPQPWAYQLGALLSAGATALLVALIVRRWAGGWGPALAGTLYLATLPMFGGAGGQTPVFYNFWMALAAWAVLNADGELAAGRVPRGVLWAMASAGFAITFKQCAVAEAGFLGLWTLHRAWRGGAPLLPTALRLAACGIAPYALFALGYALIGHFAEFWHAMVTANLNKPVDPWGDHWSRIRALAQTASPALVLAALGLLLPRGRDDAAPRAFLIGWVLAGLAGVAMLPNFYDHYLLPLMLPLAVAAGRLMGRGTLGMFAGGLAVFIFTLASPALEVTKRHRASAEIRKVAALIAARQPNARLLVYEGPMALYSLTGQSPPSPLLDNFHLYFPFEHDTSHLSTMAEMRRILAWHPQVVVTYADYPAAWENPHTAPLVHAYTAHCKVWARASFTEAVQTTPIVIYGDC